MRQASSCVITKFQNLKFSVDKNASWCSTSIGESNIDVIFLWQIQVHPHQYNANELLMDNIFISIDHRVDHLQMKVSLYASSGSSFSRLTMM